MKEIIENGRTYMTDGKVKILKLSGGVGVSETAVDSISTQLAAIEARLISLEKELQGLIVLLTPSGAVNA